jgi:hypothetical protein
VLKTSDASELMLRLLATMLQELVDAEASAFIGALPHERTEVRTTQRNGTRAKVVTTGGVGQVVAVAAFCELSRSQRVLGHLVVIAVDPGELEHLTVVGLIVPREARARPAATADASQRIAGCDSGCLALQAEAAARRLLTGPE